MIFKVSLMIVNMTAKIMKTVKILAQKTDTCLDSLRSTELINDYFVNIGRY